jgi:hypothetical protein
MGWRIRFFDLDTVYSQQVAHLVQLIEAIYLNQ